MKKLLVLFVLILFQSGFSQQGYRPNPFSKTLVVGFEPGVNFSVSDYSGSEIDYSGRFFLEVFFKSESKSSFGLRALFGAGFLSGSDNQNEEKEFRTRFASIGLGLIYLISASDYVYPFLSVGVSHIWFEPRGKDGKPMFNFLNNIYQPREINFWGELGSRFLLTDNLSLNLNGGIQISPYDNLDDLQRGTSNDMFFTGNIGISYSLFTETDSDRDGVPDSRDKCSDTPLGVQVDEFGCPKDSDNDGVPDYLDKCPNTPRGVQVDSNGCPIDSDGDGVPDYRDLCPDTPKRIPVDDFGCPFDSDNDGVPDYLDKCPNTPAGVDVDSRGCPLDSDLDGIPDYLDQCPDSAPGEIVDEKGCKKIIEFKVPSSDTLSIKAEPIKQMILYVSEIFDKNGVILKKSAIPELDTLLFEMKRDPLSRWRIESNTDNVGSVEGNLKMSVKRAEAVQNYFLSRGISKIRIEAVGLGSKFPIADNKTESGRYKNRRIVIKRIN